MSADGAEMFSPAQPRSAASDISAKLHQDRLFFQGLPDT